MSEPTHPAACTPPDRPMGGEGGRAARAGGQGEGLNRWQLAEQKEAPEGFPFEERRLRYRLGLTVKDMRDLRRRVVSAAEFTIHKKRLYLSQAALAKLQEALGQKTAGPRLEPGASEKAPVKTEVQTLKVVRADLKNRRMILACVLDDRLEQPKRPLRVRVQEPGNFVVGMEIPARQVAGYADLYDLARACPRQKGKW